MMRKYSVYPSYIGRGETFVSKTFLASYEYVLCVRYTKHHLPVDPGTRAIRLAIFPALVDPIMTVTRQRVAVILEDKGPGRGK